MLRSEGGLMVERFPEAEGVLQFEISAESLKV